MFDRYVTAEPEPSTHRSPPRLAALAAALALVLGAQLPANAQDGTLSGVVIDAGIEEPVVGALVELVTGTGRVVRSTTTDEAGRFTLTGLPQGRFSLIVSTLGYQTQRIDAVNIRPGTNSVDPIRLVSRALQLNPVVVTASKQEEKATSAPASVYTVESDEVEEEAATTAVEHVRGVPGVDVATTGLQQHNVVARGFNNIFSGALFVITDNRWASVPSLRFNAYNMIPATNEDIERIELVLGPGSALYGPNVDRGVMHIITQSPLNVQETNATVVGGLRGENNLGDGKSVWQTSFRHSDLINENVGYKVSGQFLYGTDWKFFDPVEQVSRAAAQGCLANFVTTNPACSPFLTVVPPDSILPDPDRLNRIGLRDFTAQRIAGDARVDLRVGEDATLVLNGGASHVGSSIELTGIGAAQADNWTYSYGQARFRQGELFAQAYFNLSNAGDTYTLRDGAAIADNSLLYVGQVQHGAQLGDRQRFIYGFDLIRTIPKTDSTITGRNESDDDFTELGGYVQSETAVTDQLDLVLAGRVDWHSVIEDVVLSPRAAVVYTPIEGQSFRFTYNRAFSQPTSNNLFLDLLSSPTLGGLPFAVRATGSRNGFTFTRSDAQCGGLCMRSPFTPEPLGGPATPLPIDATLFWDAAVQVVLQQTGGAVDLRPLPAPSAAQVGSDIRKLNPTTGAFDAVADPTNPVTDIGPIEETITNTLEAGYKGLIADRLMLGVDVYYTQIEDFIGPLLVETPNVFLNREDLTAYLSNFMPAAQAAQIAASMAGVPGDPDLTGIPLGTITPDNNPGNPADLFLTYRNFGDVDLWGADLGITVLATDEITLSGSYSWTSDDFFANLGGITDVALNAPQNKGSITARYRSPRQGLRGELRGRFVDSFPVNSGVFTGSVDDYFLVDANVSYALPFSRRTEVTLTARNIFDDQHQEMVGAPELGRLLLLRVKRSF